MTASALARRAAADAAIVKAETALLSGDALRAHLELGKTLHAKYARSMQAASVCPHRVYAADLLGGVAYVSCTKCPGKRGDSLPADRFECQKWGGSQS